MAAHTQCIRVYVEQTLLARLLNNSVYSVNIYGIVFAEDFNALLDAIYH